MKRKLVGQHNQCAACNAFFNSNAAFDKHRIGEFGKDRRCMSVEEMTARGMSLNATGWWVTAKMPENVNPSSYSDENKRGSAELATQGSAEG